LLAKQLYDIINVEKLSLTMTEKKPKKILIAEDDRPIAKALQLKLQHSGFEVEVVNDGEEAMIAVNEKEFDMILLDLMMPKKDGFVFLTELKQKKNKTPVIILSNLSQEGDIKKTKDLGAVGYFVKSNTPLIDIVANIKKILGA
jgi:DNA-binding response OmpR family regulator